VSRSLSLSGAVVAALLVAAPLGAQSWSGPAALAIEVRDRGGRPVPEATVRLRHTAVEGSEPFLLQTDAQGRLAVGGLAEGEWYVEIAHPDFMAFTAYLQLRAGKNPRSTFAAQVGTETSWTPLRVAFSRPRGSPPPPTAIAVAPPPAPATPPAAPATPPAPPPAAAPPTSSPPAPAPAAPPPSAPARAPTPTAPPVPPPAAPSAPPATAPAPTGAATPTAPAPVPTAPPPTPPVATVPPAPAPPPVAAPIPTPQPPPAPAPVAPATPPVARRAPCPECQPGEWAVAAETGATGAGGPCPSGGPAGLGPALRSLVTQPVAQAQPLVDRGTIGAAFAAVAPAGLAAFLAPGSACRLAAVALPAGARYVGYRYEAWDGGVAADCLAGQDCPAGMARWPDHAAIDRGADGILIWGLFESRAGAAPRAGRLTVYFRPPAGSR
jgi:hypothetical protein